MQNWEIVIPIVFKFLETSKNISDFKHSIPFIFISENHLIRLLAQISSAQADLANESCGNKKNAFATKVPRVVYVADCERLFLFLSDNNNLCIKYYTFAGWLKIII